MDYPDIRNDALGRLLVFFEPETEKDVKLLLLRYVNQQLEKMALRDSVQRERVYQCLCGYTIPTEAINGRKRRGAVTAVCPVCVSETPIDDLAEESTRPDIRVADIETKADAEQQRQKRLLVLSERERSNEVHVVLCHNHEDRPVVQDLEQRLREQGILAWIDEHGMLVIHTAPIIVEGWANPVEQTSQEQVIAAVLRQILAKYFNESELRDLCFDLNIDYESLPGQGKGDKARELADYSRRRRRTTEVLLHCRRMRPEIDWQHLGLTISSAQLPTSSTLALEQVIDADPVIAVVIGKHALGPLREQEYFQVLQRFLELRKLRGKTRVQPVFVPVLLPDAPVQAEHLPHHVRHLHDIVDFRQPGALQNREQMHRFVQSILACSERS
jgi:effector-associated domain 7 (EAD7)-containing protein